MGVLKDLNMAITRPMFTPGAVREEILGNAQDKLEPVAAFLGDK